MILQAKDLEKKFGKQIAVDKISFELEKGTVTGFIGPNGSGKTTTMKMISGLLEPTSGEIFVNDRPFKGSKAQKQLIGYLPEHNPLYLDMYVKEYLHFIAKSFSLTNVKAKVDNVIELTGLQKEAHKLIKYLSKGYRQRVGLAQAIIHDPQILILDEPTTGLDPNQIIEIRNLITEISKEKAVILSTHILQEVEVICQKILFIHQGKLIANQKAEDFRKNLSNKSHIIEIEFKEKIEDNWISSFEQILSFKRVNEYIWHLFVEGETDIREQIFNYAKNNNLNILSLQRKEKSMEDTFREMTNSN